jgi:quercetin dioxygenase-like cupin family protein
MSGAVNTDRVIRFLGNNEINVLVSSEESGGAYCIMELLIQPRGGATVLHTDRWLETFHVIDGEVEWTLERDGELVTWVAKHGETIVVPTGMKHRFAGAGETPSRMLTVGLPEYEQFFRALAAAWQGPYDREKTPQAVGPVFEKFGMRICSA